MVELSEATSRSECTIPQNGILPIIRFRYLPLHRLSGWDLASEPGLEQLIYLQNMIDEDEIAEVLGW